MLTVRINSKKVVRLKILIQNVLTTNFDKFHREAVAKGDESR